MPKTTYEDGFYSCTPGKILLGKILAGQSAITYTRASIGKGTLADDIDPRGLTAPPGFVLDGRIVNVSSPVAGECHITIQVSSEDVDKAFFATGVMLYALDPDVGEVPYTYFNLQNEPAQIRGKGSRIAEIHTFDLVSIVDDVQTVTALIPDVTAARGAVYHTMVTVPASAWKRDVTNGYIAQVAMPEALEDLMAIAAVSPDSAVTAACCDLEEVVDTLDGSLIFRAVRAPANPVDLRVVLFRSGAASALHIGWDGTLSHDDGMATDAEVAEMLDRVFNGRV